MKKFIVTKNAMRPASTEERCFYCHQNIGDEHKDDCVLVCKKAILKFTIELPVEVPASWEESDIDYRYNESTWCAHNLADMIENAGCICEKTEAEVVSIDEENTFLDEK